MTVRKPLLTTLKPQDLDAVVALDRRALGGLWSARQWRCELDDQRRPGVGLWQGQALLAMASGWLVVDELHITALAVDPDQRRCGLGLQVLNALLAEGRQQGALHATLEVAAGNRAAVALYARAGFATAGLRRGYYRSGDDALIQWQRLA